MSSTFNFEELDSATHDYLVAVRECGGQGSPGYYTETSDTLPGCGCILGPIIIGSTLALTLIPTAMILNDPIGLAMLQTAGLLVGAWLFMAKFRVGTPNNKIAGNWVFVDPLHIYEAYREQITVTPIDDVIEARVTHNYSNDSYSNSVVEVMLGGKNFASVTIPSESRAEQIRTYLNYLAWARGPDGGERANLAPATLGGLAKYVAKHGDEPLDAENNINLSMIELDINEVAEEPTREGRAMPSILPYILLLLFGGLCFCVLAFIVNPPMRDHEIYDVVMKEPWVEPRNLRAYLIDSRNTAHRDEVTRKLATFYDKPIAHVRASGKNPQLREGMAKMLESVQTAANPVCSVRVVELNTPAGKEDGKAAREKDLRTRLVNGLNAEFSKQSWGRPITLPEGNPAPPPIGEQLIAYIEKPEDAEKAHFDIEYSFGNPANEITVTVTIRTDIAQAPVATATLKLQGVFGGTPEQHVQMIAAELVKAMAGDTNAPMAPVFPAPPPGGF
jgi:hypothetical protein